MENQKKVTAISSKSQDITTWYTDVCTKAELMDYASAKGFIVYRPDGYALWEGMQAYLDQSFKALGVRNVYLPTLIPMSLLQKEKDHVEGFAPECAVVTRGGDKELSEQFVVRPTSETLFCDYYKDIVHSYNDLPVLNNQWCSVVRWEKTTRPFLRGAEFLWQEGHTLHASEDEAREFALSILRIYNSLGKDVMAIPFVTGRKPASEKFAGAVDTFTIEALMPDGQALQCGTSHYLGTGFTNAFGIKYTDKTNKVQNPFYDSWGVSTRLIGALIMVHGDDNGLVLPPKIAPTQIVIVPIRAKDNPEVEKKAKEIFEALKAKNLRVKLDDSDKTPGWKFAQYEMKGVPLRVEIGPKDLEKNQVVLTRRVDGVKEFVSLDGFEDNVVKQLDDIQATMYKKAYDFLKAHIFECKTKEEVDAVLKNHKGFCKMMSSDTKEEEEWFKKTYSATPRVLPFDEEAFGDTDPITGEKASQVLYWARAY
jgi:prolyl-tRNA synthetase